MLTSGCVPGKTEQLYIFEIFVEAVRLLAEKLNGTESSSLGVDIRFNGFPLFRVFQTSFELTKQEQKKQIYRDGKYRIINFNAGKVYVLVKDPAQLIKNLRIKPGALDVYKIKDILNCPYEVIKQPLGETSVTMSGCLCDQVIMAGNDVYHLPKSYKMKNTFGLTDDERNPSGFVSLFIRLTCFGKFTDNEYSITQKKLIFKNNSSKNEYLCVKVPFNDEDDRNAAEEGTKVCDPNKVFEETELTAPPRTPNIAGLSLICQELGKTDGYPSEVSAISPTDTCLIKAFKNPMSKEKYEINERPFARFHNAETSTDRVQLYAKPGPCSGINCAGGICTGI